MSEASALDPLCRLLRGEPAPGADWSRIIGLANRALITPRLDGLLDGAAPADVRGFVQEVARRNQQRNDRLFALMGEAAAALNAAGITPLVLKGGAVLARTGGRCPRVINDIDLVTAPEEVETALAALRTAGFPLLARHAGDGVHAVAELGRPEDVGLIDLHQRPPGPPGFVAGPEFLAGPARQVGAGRVRTPEPHMHIYLQALHDQLHDGDYWRGGFDLRHAWDLADLIQGEEPVDWERLRALPPTRLTAHAVEAQLMACHRLTHAAVPAWARGWRARLRERRQRLQHRAPLLAPPLAALAALSEAGALLGHRGQDRLRRAAAGLPPRPHGLAQGLERVRLILTAQPGGRP